MKSPSNNHALALRSDGTLVAWGNNSYGQLNLPTGVKYTDVDAGTDFSLAISEVPTGGTVSAAGRDDYGQVSNAPKGEDYYIAIEAADSTGTALTHNGTIMLWGKTLPGVPAPTDAGYTDIALGPDWGFAIKESTEELYVTGPLGPGEPVDCVEPSRIGAEVLIG